MTALDEAIGQARIARKENEENELGNRRRYADTRKKALTNHLVECGTCGSLTYVNGVRMQDEKDEDRLCGDGQVILDNVGKALARVAESEAELRRLGAKP